jgi:hypothetical protein
MTVSAQAMLMAVSLIVAAPISSASSGRRIVAAVATID